MGKKKEKGWYRSYEKLAEMGKGGNGEVYRVKCKKTGAEFALKQLVNCSEEKKVRFVDEISIIKDNYEEIGGILPVIEYSTTEYWYTMPIATPITECIFEKNADMVEIVNGTIDLCSTLEKLHEKGIAHRDIKPANIYYYDGRFSFGDFGLAEFPENTNSYTRTDKGLGAIFTIAPEMKRNPKDGNGKKADVFSLAKTLWMFLTKDDKGFDGVYDYLDSSYSLRYNDKYINKHTVEIDELLRDATDNNPDNRPTVKEFKERLINWIDIYGNIEKSQASDWNFLSRELFGLYSPESTCWGDINDIINILNVIGKTPAYNHMFFSGGGGLDFSYAELAYEENCIKLYDTTGFCHIVKPKRLYYEGFERNFKWNYFLLELNELKSVMGSHTLDEEYLVEDSPGHYVSARYSQYGVYDYETGIPLPAGYKIVYRYTKGKILIVMKSGPYNEISATYDGRHGDCKASEFRIYIAELIKTYTSLYHHIKQGKNLKLTDKKLKRNILNLPEIAKNPFKKDFSKEDNEIESKKMFANSKKSEEYIKHNFMYWNFSDLFPSCSLTNSGNIEFSFEFNTDFGMGLSYEKLIGGTTTKLYKDGYIKKAEDDTGCYYIYDRKKAIKFEERIEKRVSEILKENSLVELKEYEQCFSIKSIKCGQPTHLFTKKEIEIAMKKADDRLDNQLVIDENGNAEVVSDIRYGSLFPVRHEVWIAGNMYVGKYSNLETLDDDYVASLQGWLSYLQTGKIQYMNYVHEDKNEAELLEKIKVYYH